MGKIINSTFVSVDGVINHMPAWHFDYVDDEHDRISDEQLQAAEALLMGRTTYEIYAGAWPQRTGRYADKINSMRKYVASTTLRTADWANTRIIADDLVEAVAKLRAESGDVLMHGFGPVSHTLINHGLLDELHLWVNPQFAGVGALGDTLLSEGTNTRLELLGTRTLGSGVVLLSYRPRVADQPG
ncbi:dihydrofolate reductase family protein [Pseudonocardia humida]|uniref:Dihydrofolate reductase family protein n=1 Tax=Pseudonocardia humida TaxID=2800819 RepID=A0ABT1AC00_9PSEU|nr:dihydrofolate reductase family protein [Pseudonocardia humida]MCO1660555.1 dihydrofolate reductase family protein [Pseudonocardia humida]